MEVEFQDSILTFKKSLTVKELLDNLQISPLTVIVKKKQTDCPGKHHIKSRG
ncbi:MAG: hypothetical protein KKF16_07940 [Euryarchaeota archaeon]|nr:hypothetical protein [Euryarchaeota archaeon]MBU4547317.1 hypothetical protein [Euryarchaeota archaeon]MBU4608771.1 hypothetical protein [Euryarchaeota archaeon]MBV1755986.1 hypothetical protein [Methanobacterium sp.]MBV1767536.1 hypothetical protein [Methanobacterium sp.]